MARLETAEHPHHANRASPDGGAPPSIPAPDPPHAIAVGPAAVLAAVRDPDGRVHHVIVAAPDARVRIDGRPVIRIRALHDGAIVQTRDGTRRRYRAHDIARVVPFPEPQPRPCARCTVPIETDDPAVRCPRCGLWHHLTPERPCWTYGATCHGCDEPSTLPDDAGGGP